MSELDFSRQLKLFNPDNQRFKIHVFGAGHLGANAVIILAKMGFKNITVYDFDNVEIGNIASQFYKLSDIDKLKVDALKELVLELTGTEINIVNGLVTPSTTIIPALDDIFILTFDNLEARKVVYNKLRNFSTILVDARSGAEEWTIKTSVMNTDNDLLEHDKLFDLTPTEIECGYKSVAYSAISTAAEICNIVKKINENQPYPKMITRNMRRNFFLTDLK